MNKVNLQKTIDLMKRVEANCPERFNMTTWFLWDREAYFPPHLNNTHASSWLKRVPKEVRKNSGHSCGTAACLAGWIQLEFAVSDADCDMHPKIFAQQFLGITADASLALFEMSAPHGQRMLHEVTVSDVIKTLEALKESR